MIWKRRVDKDEDARLWAFLKRHDPVLPPSDLELTILESRIMAQVKALPDPSVPADIPLSGWMVSRKWALGGVATGVLFVVLGFGTGRAFDDLFSPPDDQTSLFAAADTTPWPSFVIAPSSTEDANDAAE
jgi:hypothetical protein